MPFMPNTLTPPPPPSSSHRSFSQQSSLDSYISLVGHSHNDYLNPSPLQTALKNGIRSIEIDVFPPGKEGKGGCRVAHTRMDLRWGVRDIGVMYVEPLKEYIESNGINNAGGGARGTTGDKVKQGRRYGKGASSSPLQTIDLLIDVKASPLDVLPVLDRDLGPLKEYITTYDREGRVVKEGCVRVLLSGNTEGIKEVITSRGGGEGLEERGGDRQREGGIFVLDGRGGDLGIRGR